MIKTKSLISMLCTLALIILCAGSAQAMPDTVKIEQADGNVVQYNLNDALESPVLLADMNNRLAIAFESGKQIIGVNSNKVVIDVGAALQHPNAYPDYESKVIAGIIEQGTDLAADLLASIGEDGTVVLKPAAEAPPVRNEGQFIGCGYHVLDEGILKGSAMKRGFIRSYQELEDDLRIDNIIDSKGEVFNSISERASEMFSELNSCSEGSVESAFFSGSLETDYKSANEMKKNTLLIKHIEKFRTNTVAFNSNFKKLIAYRDEEFIKDIDALGTLINDKGADNPEVNDKIDQLFEDYGTHIVIGYELGGKLEMSYVFSNQVNISDTSIGVAIEASYKTIGGTDTHGENETTVKKHMEEINNHSELKFVTEGGDSLSGNTTNDLEELARKWDTWKNSIIRKPSISGIDIRNQLIGIWRFTDETDPSAPIAKAMEERFNELAAKSRATLNGYDFSSTIDYEDWVMTDLYVYTGETKEKALYKIPKDYYIVRMNPEGQGRYELDANKDAGGDYIYIAYKMERYKENVKDEQGNETEIMHQDILDKAILDIAITKNRTPIEGYKEIKVDLNQGTTGTWIGLNYLKKADDRTNYYKAIKEISGYFGGKDTPPSGWTYPYINRNLNEGVENAGSIYLLIKR